MKLQCQKLWAAIYFQEQRQLERIPPLQMIFWEIQIWFQSIEGVVLQWGEKIFQSFIKALPFEPCWERAIRKDLANICASLSTALIRWRISPSVSRKIILQIST